jgi:50S ribosomal protein L16 3-hydroxylase
MLAAIRVDRATLEAFVGSYLTEPKPDVYFVPPAEPMSAAAFARALAARGIALDRRTQLLYDARCFYINGMAVTPPRGARRTLARFADRRALSASQCARLTAAEVALLHDWYRDGFVELDP